MTIDIEIESLVWLCVVDVPLIEWLVVVDEIARKRGLTLGMMFHSMQHFVHFVA